MSEFDDLIPKAGGAQAQVQAQAAPPSSEFADLVPHDENEPTTALGRALKYGGGLGGAALDGLTFNNADELRAGVRGAIDAVTGGPGYDARLDESRAKRKAFAAENPVANTAMEIGGSLAGLGKLGQLARIAEIPTVLGRSVATGAGAGALAGFGAGEGGLENRLGSAGNGLGVGAGLGVAFPAVGALVKGAGQVALPVGSVARTLLGKYDADARALDRIGQKIEESGKTPDEILTAVQNAGGKPVSLLDVGGEQTQRLGRTVSDMPGPGSSNIKQFLTERDLGTGDNPLLRTAGAADRIGKDLETTFGDKLFHATDDALIASQKEAAQPLYQRALQGGSIAPLEKQFEKSFGDAVSAERAAQTEVQDAQRKLLQNRAADSQTGNVYSSAGITAEGREAQSAFEAAQGKLERAQADKDSILGRLRQAQSDASANAPGAVWSPRVQQFLDDPIMKQGLREGVEVQRLESLAEGKRFDPRELAITGFSEAGDPIVAAVPNMRTLDTAKRGLDKILEGYRDSTTGRLMLDQRGRAIDQVRRSYVKELDNLNGDYKPARDAWAGPAQSRDALRAGRSAINADEADVTRRFSALEPAEQEMFKVGFKKALFDKVKATPDGADELKRIVGTPAMRERLGAILSPSEFGDLMGHLGTEAKMYGTKGNILGGPNTAPRLADQVENIAADAMASIAKKGPVGAAADYAVRKVAEAGGMTKRVADSASKFLTETDPDKLAQILSQLQGRTKITPTTTKALMTYGLTRQQALTAALATQQADGR